MKQLLPPEWAPQWGVMLTWPRPDGDFADIFESVESNFVAIATAISRCEYVLIGHAGNAVILRDRLSAAGTRMDRVHLYPIESDDVWARDHGPITVLRDGAPLHLDFIFNGWGGKFSAERDNRITRTLAQSGALRAPVAPLDFVLEGGGIEVDGAGSLLTTERCLLAPTRNPQFDRRQIEDRLKEWFGVTQVLWLKHGDLAGDDTDGHIDTIARYCDPHTIAYQACEDTADQHYAELKAMENELRTLRDAAGQPYRLVPLPLPQAIHDPTGQRLPAGYANFLIVNGAVLAPIYGDAADGLALERLRSCFPKRQVVGIDCRALIPQYGSLHCVTMQIPQETAAPTNGQI